jgi:hypothetical protein
VKEELSQLSNQEIAKPEKECRIVGGMVRGIGEVSLKVEFIEE